MGKLVDRLPVLVAVLGLALVALFDMTSSLPFNDEFFYQWTARRLAQGHGLHLFPGQAPIALVQLVLGGAGWSVVPDPRAARLMAIPFVALAAWALFRLAADLGASRFYCGVAAAVPVGLPVYAASATGFMSEPFYLGLLLACCAAAARWLRTGAGGFAMVVLAVLAALERQHAAAIPPALTIAMLVAARQRRVTRGETAWLAIAWVAVAMALVLPGLAGFQTEQMRLNVGALAHPSATAGAAVLLYLPGMVGLPLLAFGGALPWAGSGQLRAWTRPLVPVFLGVAVLVTWLTFILPGNYLTRAGLNPVTAAGTKPDLYGVLIPVIGLGALGALLTLAARPRSMLTPFLHDPRSVFLLAVGGAALIPMVNGDVFDRYYLAVVLPCVPLMAVVAGRARWSRIGKTWAVVLLLAGLGMYAAGEQDYQAWQQARGIAETMAERSVPAREIFSGFEPYGVRVVLPRYEETGQLGFVNGRRTTTAEVPAHPRIVLLITGPGDPRPGASYNSLKPGRVVLEYLDPNKPG